MIEIKPVARWSVDAALGGGDESKNISGIACAERRGDRWSGLMISDEMRYARFVRVHREGRELELRSTIALLPRALGREHVEETDAEGVDFDDGRYYVIGSHGVKKLGGDVQASRYFVYRFRVDPDGGEPDFDHGGDDPPPQVHRTDKLAAVIAATPPLDGFMRRSLQENGVNIEGLAVRGGQLHAGFRSPVLDGQGFILRVAVADLFGDAPAESVARRVFAVRLRERCGVRDLAKVKGGFLVLTGQAPPALQGRAEHEPAEIYWWDGADGATVLLGRLGGRAPGAKPEALLVLDENSSTYRVLVLSDGVAGGAPTEYIVPARRTRSPPA